MLNSTGTVSLNPFKFTANLASYFQSVETGNYDFHSDFYISSEDGKTIKTHKIILASQCSYYRGLFRTNPTLECSTVPIRYPVLKACIDSLYTLVLPNFPSSDMEDFKEMLLAANYLGLEQIVSVYSNKLVAGLNFDSSTCFELLQWSHDNCFEEIKKAATSSFHAKLNCWIGGLADNEESRNIVESLTGEDYLKGLEVLSDEVLFSTLLSFRSSILSKNRELHVTTLNSTARLLHMIIQLIVTVERSSPESAFPEETKVFIREKVLTEESLQPDRVHDTLLALLMSSSLSQHMSRADIVNTVTKSFVLEEVLSTSAQIRKHSSLYYILSSLNSSGFYEQQFSKFLSLMPPCIIDDPDPLVVLETQISPMFGVHPDSRVLFDSTSPHGHKAGGLRLNLGIIKKITVFNRLWDDRNVVKGLEITFRNICDSDDDIRPIKIGLGDKKSPVSKTFELHDDEYISYVKGRKGWMLDRLTFVTNKGRKFGPVGGDGGDPFCTVTDRHRKLLKEKRCTGRVVLRGIAAIEKVQQGSLAIGNVQFVSTVMCRPGHEALWRDALL